jgi:hypothetical protein
VKSLAFITFVKENARKGGKALFARRASIVICIAPFLGESLPAKTSEERKGKMQDAKI